MDRLEIIFFPDPKQWLAVSGEESRIVATAPNYPALADELNRQKREHVLVLAPAA